MIASTKSSPVFWDDPEMPPEIKIVQKNEENNFQGRVSLLSPALDERAPY